MKILLTSTSFQDTPGSHHHLLNKTGWTIDFMRGPIKEAKLLPVISKYDGLICGDDDITEAVLIKAKKGKLKAISKYGIGLDKINLDVAMKLKIPVKNTPGVNHIAVAEHILALLFSFYKNIHLEYLITKKGRWDRLIGREIFGKTIGIFGLGRIGRELAKKSYFLGLKVAATDIDCDVDFINEYNISWYENLSELASNCDILSLNSPLNNITRGCLNKDVLKKAKKNILIVNTSRGEVVDIDDLIWGLREKKISGYLADVLDEEPIIKENPLMKFDNVLITPHIASRTYESVQRQGSMAVLNLIDLLKKY